ncbi:hypothetical protein PINS_up006953 [Pythium insidiosum]|nr:hypothetical protein PINS_up006953 [Pythium insidiosum]
MHAASLSSRASMPSPQHMKYEFGVGASGSGGSDHEIFVLGKFERVPQQNNNDRLDELLPAPINFTSSAAFESFRYGCFQAVEMEERRVVLTATFAFTRFNAVVSARCAASHRAVHLVLSS